MWPFLQTTNTNCDCQQTGTNQCGCNKISSLDVSYNGPALICSGIELCDSLSVALQKIEEKICTAGNIFGSGTNNYIPKWTPNGTTLGNSQMRDNGVTIGIGTFFGSPIFKFSIVSNLPNTFINNTINTTTDYFALSAGASDNTIVPKNNYTGTGILGYANSSTTQNIGISGRGSGIDAVLNIGVYGNGVADLNYPCVTSLGGKFEAGFGTNNYSVQLIDGTQQTGRFLKSVTGNGHANWANITTADITGFPSSVVGGSGTENYLARWTPDGSNLGIGLIQDNNTSIGIKTSPDSERLIKAASSTHRFGNFVEVSPTVTTPGQNTIAIYASAEGTNTGADTFGISGYASGSTSQNSGVLGAAIGITTAENFGGSFIATNSSVLNTAVTGAAKSSVIGINIGGKFEATSSSTANYSVQLIDGTEAVDKALTSVTSDGKANWNKISSSYTTGATGSFTSQDGKTITVTNGLITSII